MNRPAPGSSSRVFNIRHDRQLNEGAGFYKQLIESAGFFNKPFLEKSETKTYLSDDFLPDDILQGTELTPGWCHDAEVGHERSGRVVAIGNRSIVITLVPIGVETLVRIEILRVLCWPRVVVHELLVASVGVVIYDWDRAGLLRYPGWRGGTGCIQARSLLSWKAWTRLAEGVGVESFGQRLTRSMMLSVRRCHRRLPRNGLLLVRLFRLARRIDHLLVVVGGLIDGVEFRIDIDGKRWELKKSRY
jgi:hypothetical protein